jgi:ribosomal protein L13
MLVIKVSEGLLLWFVITCFKKICHFINQIKFLKVKVINLSKIRFTGKKLDQKLIRWHTGYVGHLKERKLKELWEKKPEEIFKKAVKGMLPKNRLLKKRIKLLELIK